MGGFLTAAIVLEALPQEGQSLPGHQGVGLSAGRGGQGVRWAVWARSGVHRTGLTDTILHSPAETRKRRASGSPWRLTSVNPSSEDSRRTADRRQEPWFHYPALKLYL
ncbi:hypothetical protein AAFF_G00324020 [Aldrovandia affinis]|uniref:Uncharacterized protein n=1 Tax=Aldrovandia affinis TaxID=143900 RepID=A0AAD7W090_9TELE|nr:hypothetical protein AAFF_G00324020 [Aldrovandia affinis]